MKKNIVLCILIISILLILCACSTPAEETPDYILAEAEETAQKVLSHQSEDSFSLIWLSDLHIGNSYKIDGKWISDDTSVIEAGIGLYEMTKTAPCDLIVLGGDLASGNITTDRDAGLAQLDACISYLRPATFFTPTLYLVGNHDDAPWRATEDRLTRAEMFSRFGKKNLLAGAVSNDSDKGCNYGFLDFENRKMRVIYLDTHDKNGWESTNEIQGESEGCDYMDACNVSAKQLHWLANHALNFSDKEMPSDWGIIVLSHVPLNFYNGDYIYTDITSGSTYTANVDNVITILTAYLSNGSGTITLNNETATYDFSNTTETAYLYGCINGHRHNYEYRDYGPKKIPGITCPNTRDGSERESQDGNTYTKTPETAESCSFSVITIDRVNRKIYADSYGAGIDREFNVVTYRDCNNLVPSAVTKDETEIFYGTGYLNNTRLSGLDDPIEAEGYVSTGIIQWRENPGSFETFLPIYIKGLTLDTTDVYTRLYLIQNVEDEGMYISGYVSGDKPGSWETFFNIEKLGEQYYKLTPIESAKDSWYNIRYFNLCVRGNGEDLIITINEPI